MDAVCLFFSGQSEGVVAFWTLYQYLEISDVGLLHVVNPFWPKCVGGSIVDPLPISCTKSAKSTAFISP